MSSTDGYLTLAEAMYTPPPPRTVKSSTTEPDPTTCLLDVGLDDDSAAQQQDEANSRARQRKKFIQDALLGASDGSTVPFALAAGLATSTSDSKLIWTGVVSELAGGFLAMSLGGYMATAAEETFLSSERTRLKQQLVANPNQLHERLSKILFPLSVSKDAIADTARNLVESNNLDAAVDFIMRNELSTEEADVNPIASMATVGTSYVVAGIIPTLPYLFIVRAPVALKLSIVVGLCSLFSFGYVKGILLGGNRTSQAIQMMTLGALAAATSYALASYVT